MIKLCDGARCDSAYQDKRYGHGKRVQNPLLAGGSRCTVCGKENDKGKMTAASKKK